MANRKLLIVAAAFGLVPAVLSLDLQQFSAISSNSTIGAIQEIGITLLFPGMLGAMAVSGNVHAFHLWVAALLNFVFYFLLCWAMGGVIVLLSRRFRPSQHEGYF